MKSKLTQSKVFVSYFVILIIWTFKTMVIRKYIDGNYILWSNEIINGVFKIIIFLGSSIYLIKKYELNLKISLKNMFINKFKIYILIIPIILETIYHIFVMIYQKHYIVIAKFHPSVLITQFIIVGILEEILFRGWFFNSLYSFMSGRRANIISSLMFVSFHYPKFIYQSFQFYNIIFTSVIIFILGIIMGYIFKKSKNIWVPTIFHMLWDLFELLIFGS